MAAALCAAALLLSGCSDDPPEPKPLDPPTGSETPTTPPTSEPPQAQTPEETIREFVRLQTEMEATGDAKAFRAMGHNCEYCEGYGDTVEGIYKRGGEMTSTGWTIKSIRPHAVHQTGRRTYDLIYDEGPTSYRWAKGSKVKREPARKGVRYKIELTRVDGQWKVTVVGDYK